MAIWLATLMALWLVLTAVAVHAAVAPVDGASRRRARPRRASCGERLGQSISCRYRKLRPAPPVPVGPPIEETAATLRRLQNWLDRYADPTPLPGKATRLAAVLLAYDLVLADACRALEISHSLAEAEGFELKAERLRVQAALREAGFVLAAAHRTGR